jgi:periplasmic mercuric ion binding protein
MKIKIIALAIVALFITMTFDMSAELREAKFQTNLHCGSCAGKIEKALKKEKGVKTVSADVETKIVTVSYESKKTNSNNVQEKIKKLGYTAELPKSACCSDKPKTTSKKETSSDSQECCSGKIHTK